MKSFLIAGFFGLAVITFLGVYFGMGNQDEAAHAAPPSATIIVLSPGVFVDTGTGTSSPATGDLILEGSAISTDATGEAELQFPSGSIARLDANSTLTIQSHFFDEASGTSQVSLFLTIGRVWSRVAKLATPASDWEVKTSNVVAAVRGTAFNVGFTKDGKSRVLVSENTVRVSAVDSTSGALIAEADVPEHTFVEVEKARIEKTKRLEVAAPPKEFLDDAWILKNKERDREAEIRVKTREEELLNNAAKTEAILKNENRSWEDYLEEKTATMEDARALDQLKSLLESNAESVPASRKTEELPKSVDTGTGGGSSETLSRESGTSSRKPVRLSLAVSPMERGYFEGTKIAFRVFAEYENEERIDITKSAAWRLEGPIGSLSGSILTAAITDPVAAEFGKAEGKVIASFENVMTTYQIIVLPKPVEDTGTGG